MKEYLQHFILKIFKLKIVKVLLLYDLVNKTICVSAFKPLKSKINPARSVPCLSTVLSNPVFKSMLWGEILAQKDILKSFSSKTLIL